LACDFAHASQTHLGEEVKVVFVNHDNFGPVLRESCLNSCRIIQHRIEDCHGHPCIAEQRGGIHRAERRIRLQLPRLLAVVVEVVGMS
jgi:hypothetical protein